MVSSEAVYVERQVASITQPIQMKGLKIRYND